MEVEKADNACLGDSRYKYVINYFDIVNDGEKCSYSRLINVCAGADNGGCPGGWYQGISTAKALLINQPTNCAAGYEYVYDIQVPRCLPVVNVWHQKKNRSLCVGNPINPLNGTKRQRERLTNLSNILSIGLVYDTSVKISGNSEPGYSPQPSATDLWQVDVLKSLVISYYPGGIVSSAQANRGGGAWISYFSKNQSPATLLPDSDIPDKLNFISGEWQYINMEESLFEIYTNSGILKKNIPLQWLYIELYIQRFHYACFEGSKIWVFDRSYR